MQFPNAAKGVKKIFTSTIIEIIATVMLLIGAVFATASQLMKSLESATPNIDTSSVIGIVIISASGVLMIISAIIYIVGLAQSAKDEGSFKLAIGSMIVYIALYVVMALIRDNEILTNVLQLLADLLSLFVTIFIIQGIINLADALGDAKVSKSGKTQFVIITFIYGLTCIANITVAIFGGQTASLVAALVSLVAEILTTVQYIIFIVYLVRAKKMLRNS